jgi:DNA polymerase-3 subunit delta
MNYAAVLSQIKQGKLSPLYLLYGEEIHLVQEIEQAVINASVAPEYRELNVTVFDRDPELGQLINAIETVPFLGEHNVIVIRDTRLFKSTGNDAADNEDSVALLRLFSNMPTYSRVIFITSQKVDKRRKPYKVLEQYGTAVELVSLKSRDVRIWLQERLAQMQKQLTPDAVEHLLSVVSLMPQISLSFLDSELEKLSLYTQAEPVITRRHLDAILSDTPEVSIFAAIEAASQKQTGKALALFTQQLATGEPPLRVVALLARQVRLLWRAKELTTGGKPSRDIAAQLNVPLFVAEKLVRQSNGFTIAKLKQAMLSLAAFDRDFKIGRVGSAALEQLIIEMISFQIPEGIKLFHINVIYICLFF